MPSFNPAASVGSYLALFCPIAKSTSLSQPQPWNIICPNEFDEVNTHG